MQDFDFPSLIVSPFHIVNRYCDLNWRVLSNFWGFHNFMMIVSGEGTCVTDGKCMDFRPGILAYHHPGQSFGFETSKTKLMHVYGVNFYAASSVCVSGSWETRNVEKLPFENFMQVTDVDILIKNFHRLSETWEKQERNYMLKCRSILLNIIYEISNQCFCGSSRIVASQKIEPVLEYIRLNLHRQIKLEEMAQITGLSAVYFCKLFKSTTGISPMEYINQKRILKSEEYLTIGCSVAETSQKTGFCDSFYFSKVFKKIKGVSPREYMKKSQNFW